MTLLPSFTMLLITRSALGLAEGPNSALLHTAFSAGLDLGGCLPSLPNIKASLTRGLQARVAGALRNGDHSDRADVRFARANIQIYDARVFDLYRWVCARYLVGVKCAETKAKRSQARLSTEFQNGSRWLSKPCPAQEQSGGQPSKNNDLPYISI